MTTPDQARLSADRARPRVTELWWALRPLTSVIRFMQSGAHPDDETSGMLAALALRDGINLSCACSTRGEGGQNDIGTEAGAALGALRTREMERACDLLGMRLYWHSEGPDDAITDFGFSKSGEETLARWGEDRLVARFVEILRTDRPDILCPTFLDVPGQHGHHRAMTRAAHRAMAAAADPGFPSNLPPWQVAKLYLPAWSGAGQAYDDDAPPPEPTLTIDGSGRDPVSGWGWERIGQQSRAFHRTQGMGRWVPAGTRRDWPLHLVTSHVPGPDDALAAGLPATLGALAMQPGLAPIAGDLTAAQAGIDAALAAFPAFDRVAEALLAAHAALHRARHACPETTRDAVLHRLRDKEVQLGEAIRLALGVEARAWVDTAFLRPGARAGLTLERDAGEAEALSVTLELPAGWSAAEDRLALAPDAPPSDPCRAAYDPADPPAPAQALAIRHGGQTVQTRLPLDAAPMILPAHSVSLAPEAAILNRARPAREIPLALHDIRPTGAPVRLSCPEGWRTAPRGEGLALIPPAAPADGLYRMPVQVDGAPASRVRTILYPHVAPTAQARPAELRLRVLDAAIPDVRVGHVGAGNDRVDHWLAAMGADVVRLSDADLASEGALARLDTIVIGIFAMRFRPGLRDAMPRLHAWVAAGGTLVTLYHRPWDDWDPDTVPPRRLEIGQPSLRWRVTDETAEVRHLADHPVLTAPNRIGPDDWAGWVKERGLYFARAWDPAYTPLVEMADPGEAPHRGALLAAEIGAGRHIHCALVLHLQMEALVPGAFRLMANMIARRA